MMTRHDRTVEPGIILCTEQSLAGTLRGSANSNVSTIGIQIDNPLRGFNISIQGSKSDFDYGLVSSGSRASSPLHLDNIPWLFILL
jgi:hypothetical protein